MGLAVLLGVGLRCSGIDHKLFWVDEVYTVFNIGGFTNADVAGLFHPPRITTAGDLLAAIAPPPDRGPAAVLHSLITEDTTHVPLYYLLTHGWVRLAGTAVTAIRLPAVLFSLLALPAMYVLAQSLFRCRRRAGLAMALMAVSPFHGLYAQEARPYSLWLLLTVVSSGLLIRAYRGRSPLAWVGYGLSVSAGLYTFLYMPLVVVAQGLYGVGLERGRWTRRLRRYALAAMAAGISFLPWLWAIAPYRENLTANTRWQVQAASGNPLVLAHNLSLTLTRGFIDFDWNYGFGFHHWWPYGLVVVATVLMLLYSLGMTIRHYDPSTWLLPLLLLVVPLLAIVTLELSSGQQQSGIPRYFTPCYVGLELAVAGWLGHWIDQPGSRRIGQITAVALLLLGALSYGNNALATTWWHQSGHYIPPVAQRIQATENPLVLLDSDAWSVALAYRLPAATAIVPFNSGLVMPGLPPNYSHYFMANVPLDWIPQYEAASGYRLQSLANLDQVPLWQVISPSPPP
jgi:uncharacterized membrane protein